MTRKRRRPLHNRRDESKTQKLRLKAIWERRPAAKRLKSAKHPVTGELTKYLWGRIGLDVGGVILTRLYPDKRRIDKGNFKEDSKLFPLAVESVRLFVLLFGAGNVVIVKNDDKKGVVASETYETLEKRFDNFFKRTGFKVDNWLVTKHRTQKGGFCRRHFLNFFADDKAQVGRYLPKETIFLWYGSEADEDDVHRLAVSKRARDGRLHALYVPDWPHLVSEVLRYYPNWEETMVGRPQEEQDEINRLYKLLMAA
ncbi:MAG: hypothetical protein EXS59_01680 [Candidatus Taylorbacteria bacterium]|nr:hypothetical protein [Candidatus Taylorbacteria bacterium]